MLSLLSEDFTPGATNCRHASLSSAFLALRQAVISFASGINPLQSLNTSGVQACRASGVPCAIDVAGAAIADTKASSKHRLLSGFSRRRIRLSWFFAFIWKVPAIYAERHHDMICTDTVSSYLAIVRKCPACSPYVKQSVAAFCKGGRLYS